MGKIVLAVVFGLVAYYFGVDRCVFSPYIRSATHSIEVCSSLPIPFIYFNPIFWGPVFLLSWWTDAPYYAPYPYMITIEWIFGIIYWYLIASAIMYMHSILKNEFNKKNNR